MGKKNSKSKSKSDEPDLAQIVDELISDVGDDRERVVNFLQDLINAYPGDGTVGIAEYVSKLADTLTRQNQVKTALIKALVKKTSPSDSEDDADDIYSETGLPFPDDADAGDSN